MSGPGGITWSADDVATTAEIVATFNRLDYSSGIRFNWGTGSREENDAWCVTAETYINGVMMTLDFDYMMGYLIQAVDRTSGICTYVAIVHYHGRRADSSIDHDFMAYPGPTHTFFGDRDVEGFDDVDVCKWAVDQIYSAIEAYQEDRGRDMPPDVDSLSARRSGS